MKPKLLIVDDDEEDYMLITDYISEIGSVMSI